MTKRYKPHKFQKEFHASQERFRTFIAGRRGGKAQPLSEPVLTPGGFVPMGSLKVGDRVCTDKGVSSIKQIYPQGEQEVYLITFSDGAKTRATGDHLWKVRFTNAHGKAGVFTTLELLSHLEGEGTKGRMSKNIQVDIPEPVAFKKKVLPIDPYILGVILGDGGITQDTVMFSSADQEIVDYVSTKYEVVKTKNDYDYRIISGVDIDNKTRRFQSKMGSIKSKLKSLDLMGKGSHTKFVPELYLHSNTEDRLSLLQGLMDTDGHIDKRGHASFYSISKRLAEQVQWLVRSLGGTATLFDKYTKYKGELVLSYCVYIQFSGDINPCRIKRKAERWRPLGVGTLKRRVLSIEKIGSEKCQCISIGGNGLYITNDFIITHNTIAGTIEALWQVDQSPRQKGRPTHGWIISPTYQMLRDVNIPVLMEWCPPESIRDFNKSENKIEFVNGSTITLRSGENPDRLRGVGLDWVWLDEACFMSKAVWEVLYPTLTDKHGIAWVTTTPQGYDWVYDTFYKPAIELEPGFKAWKFTTLDNPYIDKELVERAKKDLSEVMFKQEYLASFEKFEGLVFPDFSEARHCKETEKALTDIYFVGLDVGWNHPTAGILAKEDVNGNLFIVDEFREQFLTAKEISNQLNGLLARNGLKEEGVEMFIIDPASKGTQQTSGQSMLFQLQEEGWPFIPGNNDVMAGINRVTRLFRENKLYIAKRCKSLIEELNNYHWRKWADEKDGKRSEPFKLGDDLVDTLRYVCHSRPDYFEHPKLNQYGQLIKEEEAITDELDISDNVEELMSGGSVIDML